MPSFVIDMSVIILGTVAPFTGAWIETFGWRKLRFRYHVAPFTGAWIETYINQSL